MKPVSLFLIILGLAFALAIVGCGAPTATTPVSTTEETLVPTLALATTDTTATAPQSTATSDAVAPSPVAGDETPVAPTTSSSAGAMEPPAGDPFEFLRSASLSPLQASSFRATTTIDTAGEQSSLVIEYVAPDRIRIINGNGTEQIAIRDRGVWSNESGDWESLGNEMVGLMFAAIEPQAVDAILNLIDKESVTYVGTEDMEGSPMYVYTYKSSVQPGSEPQTENRIWIGVDDKRVHRLEARGPSLTDPAAQDLVNVAYEYDVPITIEAPI